jgi:hypothetical protein
MKKVITFGKPLNQTVPEMAGSLQFAFPFSVVDSDLIGTPEEQPATKHHCITVKVSDVKVKIWELDTSNEPYTEKILFRYASKYVAEKIRTDSLLDELMLTITNHTHPDNKLPFDPTRINTPNRTMENVEIERRIKGFDPH